MVWKSGQFWFENADQTTEKRCPEKAKGLLLRKKKKQFAQHTHHAIYSECVITLNFRYTLTHTHTHTKSINWRNKATHRVHFTLQRPRKIRITRWNRHTITRNPVLWFTLKDIREANTKLLFAHLFRCFCVFRNLSLVRLYNNI